MPAACVDRRFRIEEIELGQRRRKIEVRFVKRANRPDVLPVAIEQMRLHIVLVDRRWNYLATEIDGRLVVLQEFFQLLIIEYVDTHGSEKRAALRLFAGQAEVCRVDAHRLECFAFWLLAELDYFSNGVSFKKAKALGVGRFRRDHRDRYVGVGGV